jgi:hypothetical protein
LIVIITQGDPSTSVYFIVSGEVRIIHKCIIPPRTENSSMRKKKPVPQLLDLGRLGAKWHFGEVKKKNSNSYSCILFIQLFYIFINFFFYFLFFVFLFVDGCIKRSST